MDRFFLDANVLFTAAHNPSGKTSFLIELAGGGYWQLVTSCLAVEEARRNLERKYPGSCERLSTYLDLMEIIRGGDGTSCPIDIVLKDRPIFEAAVLTGASHLLTGDIKHFGAHMNKPAKTAGIIVQTVADFLKV